MSGVLTKIGRELSDTLTEIFRANPKREIAEAVTRAQTEALFVPSMLRCETRKIDPPTASLEEIENALSDCRFYWSHAYPETENELVSYIEGACYAEIDRRLSGTIRETMLRRVRSG